MGYEVPNNRNRLLMFDCTGRYVPAHEMKALLVGKLCLLDKDYHRLSNKQCLDIWNKYYYGTELEFSDEKGL